MEKVLLVCDHKGCPRRKKLDFDPKTMPRGTAYLLSECDWHVGDTGWEEAYDKNNKLLNPTSQIYEK